MKLFWLFYIPLLLAVQGAFAQLQTGRHPQKKEVLMPFPNYLGKPASDMIKRARIPGIRRPGLISPDSLQTNVRSFITAHRGKCPSANNPAPSIVLQVHRANALQADVTWETKYASAATGFNVERSLTDTLHFVTVNYQLGNLGKNAKQNYGLTDENSSTAISYYRIRQLNADKTFLYSNVASIAGLDQLSMKLYPNPATAKVWIKTNAKIDPKSMVNIYDAKGQLVLQESISSSNDSQSAKIIDVSVLAKGLYQVALILPDHPALLGTFVKQ